MASPWPRNPNQPPARSALGSLGEASLAWPVNFGAASQGSWRPLPGDRPWQRAPQRLQPSRSMGSGSLQVLRRSPFLIVAHGQGRISPRCSSPGRGPGSSARQRARPLEPCFEGRGLSPVEHATAEDEPPPPPGPTSFGSRQRPPRSGDQPPLHEEGSETGSLLTPSACPPAEIGPGPNPPHPVHRSNNGAIAGKNGLRRRRHGGRGCISAWHIRGWLSRHHFLDVFLGAKAPHSP